MVVRRGASLAAGAAERVLQGGLQGCSVAPRISANLPRPGLCHRHCTTIASHCRPPPTAHHRLCAPPPTPPTPHLDGLHLEGHLAVLGEHAAHGVEHDLRLGQVGGGALDEHVARLQADGAVRAVDDGRQRQHGAAGVVDDRVHDGVLDDGHKPAGGVVVVVLVWVSCMGGTAARLPASAGVRQLGWRRERRCCELALLPSSRRKGESAQLHEGPPTSSASGRCPGSAA